MAYLEHCCIENQLPQLLRRERGNALFQTNGDVTIEKMMSAACCLASGGFGEYWICVKEVDVVLMRFLRHWMSRGWIRELRLLTVGDQRELVASELGEELMKHVDYGWREGLGLEAFCVVGERESMVVQGEMLLVARTEPVMTAYSAAVGSNERMLGSDGAVGSLVENLRAVLRVQKRKTRKRKEEKPDGGEAAVAQQQTEQAAQEAEGRKASEAEKPEAETVEQPTVEEPKGDATEQSTEGTETPTSEAETPTTDADAQPTE